VGLNDLSEALRCEDALQAEVELGGGRQALVTENPLGKLVIARLTDNQADRH
jgi:hypothetical protein